MTVQGSSYFITRFFDLPFHNISLPSVSLTLFSLALPQLLLSSPSPLSHTILGSQSGSWPGVRTRQDMWAWSQRPGTEEQEGSACGVRRGTNSILYHSA